MMKISMGLALALALGACAARPDIAQQTSPTASEPSRAGLPSRAGRKAAPTMLRVLVRENGAVGDIDVQSSSGDAQLDRLAVSTVRSWQFVPKIVDGKPVADWVDVPLEWEP